MSTDLPISSTIAPILITVLEHAFCNLYPAVLIHHIVSVISVRIAALNSPDSTDHLLHGLHDDSGEGCCSLLLEFCACHDDKIIYGSRSNALLYVHHVGEHI